MEYIFCIFLSFFKKFAEVAKTSANSLPSKPRFIQPEDENYAAMLILAK